MIGWIGSPRLLTVDRMTHTAAIDALAGLFRLPDCHVGDSRVACIHAAADLVRNVGDLDVPPASDDLQE
jgi:hypothetical protein